MADIAMCCGKDCAARQSCYRFRALSDGDYQSYSDFDRLPIAGREDCAYFWPVEQAEGPLAEE
jgi:hypothetical protein